MDFWYSAMAKRRMEVAWCPVGVEANEEIEDMPQYMIF
jgi:hypothetical protein